MRITAFFGAAMLLIAGCGSGVTRSSLTTAEATTTIPAPPSASAAEDFPVTVTAANGDVTIDGQPKAIVSLSATATEMVAAIDALDQLVAVDDQSDYPADVPSTDLSGYTPNLEAIIAFQPDLVLVANDTDGLVAALTSLGIPVLLLPAAVTFDDVYSQIVLVGVVTGHQHEADHLVMRMQSEIDTISGSAPSFDPPLTFYHELDSTFFSVTSSTFIGSVYALLALENIADPADADGFGYPQLSAEYIIEQDPNLIFLADTECCGQTALTVAERPGWAALTAVQTGAVVELSDDVASRWGPRVVDFLRTVADSVVAWEPTA